MKNFVFDLYNTLISVRTDEHCERAWAPAVEYFRAHGIDCSWEMLMTKFDEYWREFNSQSAGGAFRYPECDCVAQFRWMARSLGGALTSRQAAEALCLMRSASVEKMEVFAGVPGLLAQLRAGGAKLYLMT